MRKPKLGTLSKSFDALLAEKRSLAEKEQRLIERLNHVLAQLGYRVDRVRRSGAASRRRRLEPSGQRVALKSTEHQLANHGQKRRGRPPLRKVA